MSTVEIYLDVAASGRVMAHLLEPPGLGLRYESRAEMQRRLPFDIEGHLAWLRSHQEPVPEGAVTFRVAEEVPISGNFESGDDVGFYGPDAEPVAPEKIERYLRIAGWAHGDLLLLIDGLDDKTLDWVRDSRTRSIRKVLRHIVGAELWYMSRVVDERGPGPLAALIRDADAQIDATENSAQRLRIVWEAFPRFARSLSPRHLTQIAVPTWHTRVSERWTARKMLRRCIEHIREHTLSIEKILQAYHAS